MAAQNIFLFLTTCGLVGIFLRQNLLNIMSSLLQVGIGVAALASIHADPSDSNESALYFLILFIFILSIFIYSIAALLIRRRSTLEINELTEMRG